MTENKEELKSLLMKVKEESGKAGLKLSIQKNNIMASGPITSWQIEGETMETVADFLFSWALKSVQMVTSAMKLKVTQSCRLFATPWTIQSMEFFSAGVQPQLIQGIRRRDGIGEGQGTTA